jgi:hypothetical protein
MLFGSPSGSPNTYTYKFMPYEALHLTPEMLSSVTFHWTHIASGDENKDRDQKQMQRRAKCMKYTQGAEGYE